MLAAATYGLVSSIAWFGSDGGPVSDAAKDLLGIPRDRLVRTMVSIGYPDLDAHVANPNGLSGRRPLSETVHDGRW